MKKLITRCAAASLAAVLVSTASAQVLTRKYVQNYLDNAFVIDGAMNLQRQAGSGNTFYPADFRDVRYTTAIGFCSSGVPGAFSAFPGHVANITSRPGIRVVLDAADVGPAPGKRWRRWSNEPFQTMFYIQKPWPIATNRSITGEVEAWFRAGLRVFQPAYNADHNATLQARGQRGFYAGGADQDTAGLTWVGRQVVRAALDRYMIVDVSHVGKASALEICALAASRGRPIIANHANARAIYADLNSRNKDDEEIRAIARTGGVVGVTAIDWMLSPGSGDKIYDMAAHVAHIANLTCYDDNNQPIDMMNHVGVATDSYYNGWWSTSGHYPGPNLSADDRWTRLGTVLMLHHGFSFADLGKVFGGNFLRVYKQALPHVGPAKNLGVVSYGFGVKWFKWSSATSYYAGKPRYDVVIQRRSGSTWSGFRVLPNVSSGLWQYGFASGQYRFAVRAYGENATRYVQSAWRSFGG